jgi:hypothetical protein
MDGKPLADVAVTFQPVDTGKVNSGAGSFARTNEKGEYTLEVVGGGKGAVIGKHVVRINPVVENDSPDERVRAPKVRIPAKYNLNSELTCEVPKEGKTDANFELKSR